MQSDCIKFHFKAMPDTSWVTHLASPIPSEANKRTMYAFMNAEMVHESQIVLHPLFYKSFMCFPSINTYILLFESQGPFWAAWLLESQ